MQIEIRLARFEEILDLRWRILRAGLRKDTANFPGDDAETTMHIGAFEDGACVGCATFMQNEWKGQPAWQLRGMAVEDGYRSLGIGAEILKFADVQIQQRGYSKQLWCNARSPAVRFYRKLGWQTVGEQFDIPTAGPHFKMTRLIPI